MSAFFFGGCSCCGQPARGGSVSVTCSWQSYWPNADFIRRQIAVAVEYVRAFDLARLPSNTSNLAIFPNLSAGVELTAALIDQFLALEAYRQYFSANWNGQVFNGSGWESNVNFDGLGVGAIRQVLNSPVRQAVCRAVWRHTYSPAPPPEYLDVYDPCSTSFEPAGALTSDVLVEDVSTHVNAPAMRQGRSSWNMAWIANAEGRYAPRCCAL